MHLGGYVGDDTPVDTRTTRVRVDVPADYGLLCIRDARILTAHGLRQIGHYNLLRHLLLALQRHEGDVENVGLILLHLARGGIDSHTGNATENQVAPEPSLHLCLQGIVGRLIAVSGGAQLFLAQLLAHLGARKAV